MGNNNKENSECWSDYWSQGHQTSFGSAFTAGYEGTIKNVWLDYFQTLTPNSRMLDLCTGNASLLRLAKACLNDNCNINLTGVDYAKIHTEDGFFELENVNLAFEINIEKLPFQNQSFDHVISNFGIEYSQFNKSIAEAARVLVTGGQVNFVCHCHDSMLIKSNAQELHMLIEMFKPMNVLDNLSVLVDALTVRQKNSQQHSSEEQSLYKVACERAEEARHKLNDNIGYIANSYEVAFRESDFLGFLKYLLSARSGDKVAALKLYKYDLQSHKARLSSMVDAALSKEILAALPDIFLKNGLIAFTLTDVIDPQGKIACQISAVKS
ncbi:class I SAM-dependent methyltransferase [Colwellia piezophila]|uniref:class I SAM-dependent methyltransferase n=1 Tax=Colwellia piezophila TaxID=211668 RepID=UPI00037D28F2|nr:class I SAM-dependent methyltransferase [Colwellia piezophila]